MLKVLKEMVILLHINILQEYGRKQFNNVRIPKKSRMGICNICASLKSKRDKFQGVERGMHS
jgi:hypothetical protein